MKRVDLLIRRVETTTTTAQPTLFGATSVKKDKEVPPKIRTIAKPVLDIRHEDANQNWMNRRMTPNETTTFDVRRSEVLSKYMKYWGQPSVRHSLKSKDQVYPVEFYSFPCRPDVAVHRFATVGMASQCYPGRAENFGFELLFVFSDNLAGASEDDVFEYLKDIAAYCIVNGLHLTAGTTFQESPIAPSIWAQKALLVSEPCGEPSELQGSLRISETTMLLWLVPIFEQERLFIKAYGFEAFDKLLDKHEQGITDLSRESFVIEQI